MNKHTQAKQTIPEIEDGSCLWGLFNGLILAGAGIAIFLGNTTLVEQKEVDALQGVRTSPKSPFTVIMGGAKVSDKIEVILSLLQKCNHHRPDQNVRCARTSTVRPGWIALRPPVSAR